MFKIKEKYNTKFDKNPCKECNPNYVGEFFNIKIFTNIRVPKDEIWINNHDNL